jgi:hypothetical protein
MTDYGYIRISRFMYFPWKRPAAATAPDHLGDLGLVRVCPLNAHVGPVTLTPPRACTC